VLVAAGPLGVSVAALDAAAARIRRLFINVLGIAVAGILVLTVLDVESIAVVTIVDAAVAVRSAEGVSPGMVVGGGGGGPEDEGREQ